jgi:hypothetical protein
VARCRERPDTVSGQNWAQNAARRMHVCAQHIKTSGRIDEDAARAVSAGRGNQSRPGRRPCSARHPPGASCLEGGHPRPPALAEVATDRTGDQATSPDQPPPGSATEYALTTFEIWVSLSRMKHKHRVDFPTRTRMRCVRWDGRAGVRGRPPAWRSSPSRGGRGCRAADVGRAWKAQPPVGAVQAWAAWLARVSAGWQGSALAAGMDRASAAGMDRASAASTASDSPASV